MSGNPIWLATMATIVGLLGYEAIVAVAKRLRQDRMARSACCIA